MAFAKETRWDEEVPHNARIGPGLYEHRDHQAEHRLPPRVAFGSATVRNLGQIGSTRRPLTASNGGNATQGQDDSEKARKVFTQFGVASVSSTPKGTFGTTQRDVVSACAALHSCSPCHAVPGVSAPRESANKCRRALVISRCVMCDLRRCLRPGCASRRTPSAT